MWNDYKSRYKKVLKKARRYGILLKTLALTNEINNWTFYSGTVPGGRQRFWCSVLLAVITGLRDAQISETSCFWPPVPFHFHRFSILDPFPPWFCVTTRLVLPTPAPAPSSGSILTELPSSGDDLKFGQVPPERAKPQLFLADAHFCFLASAASVSGHLRGNCWGRSVGGNSGRRWKHRDWSLEPAP